MTSPRSPFAIVLLLAGACSSSATGPLPGSDAAAMSDAGGAGDGGGAGTDGSADAAIPSTAGCKYQANKTGLSAFQQVGGLAFHVYAPSNYNPAVAHTVVVIMHGQDSDGTAELGSLWQAIADSEQLVLVAPKGSRPATDPATYPNGANWSVNDLNLVQDLITEIDACYNVNPQKHLLWGFSEGCFYGYLLGIGAASQFSGLAMGGGNAGFARQNNFPPSKVSWKIPVSHVQGTMDPNGTAPSIQDQSDFQAVGSVFTLRQPVQGHTITSAQVLLQYNDLKSSLSP